MRSPLNGRRIAALVTTIAATLSMVVGGAPVAASPSATALIIGDSVTARYNNIHGDPMQGWYSILGEQANFTPIVAAQEGSGVLMQGYAPGKGRCSGIKFWGQMGKIAEKKPDIIIVEGGRNDLRRCDITKIQSTAVIEKYWGIYLDSLVKTAAANGISKKDIYLISPWGQRDFQYADAVRGVQRRQALRVGINWIGSGLLTCAQASDGGHPTPGSDGSAYLANRAMVNGAGLATRFR